MTPIKVLHVTSVEKRNYYLTNLKAYSDSAAVDHSFVTLAAADCDFVEDFQNRGWRVFGLDTPSRWSYPKVFFQLSRLIKSLDPEIVHTHLFDASLLGLTAAKRLGIKTVLTRHHSDAIHKLSNPLKRRFYLSLENYISRNSDHIIAPSQMVKDVLVDAEGAVSDKVTVIPYGQTTERFDAVTAEEIARVRNELAMDGRLSLVNVSRLYHRKGHAFLFEAFAALIKDGLVANLYLVGDGDFKSELKAMCAKLGIADRVKFLGWREDALAIIAASDIVVHPSLEDALSSAVIESVMLEKPIIASDISGVRDTLCNGMYGTIVPPADSESMIEAMRKTIGDLDAAREKAVEGRKYLLEYMSAGRVAREYENCYRNFNAKIK